MTVLMPEVAASVDARSSRVALHAELERRRRERRERGGGRRAGRGRRRDHRRQRAATCATCLGGGLELCSDGQSHAAARLPLRRSRTTIARTRFDVSARTELYDRNTGARDLATRALRRGLRRGRTRASRCSSRAWTHPTGCFEERRATARARSRGRTRFQAGWTQAWTPILSTQLTATAQLLHGFQANPYRAVRHRHDAAQEHHPDDRARYALGARRAILDRAARRARCSRSCACTATPGTSARGPPSSPTSSRWRGPAAARPRPLLHAERRRVLLGRLRARAAGPVLHRRPRAFADAERAARRAARVDGAADDQGEVLGLSVGLELVLKGDLLKSSSTISTTTARRCRTIPRCSARSSVAATF